MAHDVFISYASSDKAVADAVCSQLESVHRIRCWIAPRDVTPGASWAESIIDALDGSKVMVLIFSSKANASMQIEREVERAVHKGINIIPLRIENTVPTKTLEYFISSPHWLDAISVPLEQHINKLAASVKALLSKQGVQIEAQRVTAPVTAPPPAATPPHVTAKPTAARRGWIAPAVITIVVAGAALAIGIGWGRMQRERNATPAATAVTPAATAANAPSNTAAPTAAIAPSAAPSSPAVSATPATPAVAAPPPASPSVTTAAATAAPGAASAAPGAAPVAVPRNPNLFVDFRNTLPEGSVTLEVNGETRWTSKLGASAQMQGQKSENLRTSLSLTPGKHKITATLHTPDGKVRDTETTSISVDASEPRTLKMTLSRFRHHVEFETVMGKPAPEPMPAGPMPVRPTATKPKPETSTAPVAPAK